MLDVLLLGEFRVTINGSELTKFHSLRTKAILAYLAVNRGTAIYRSDLLDFFWHEYERNAAQATLRVSVSNLRDLLDPYKKISVSRYTIELPDCYCDVLDHPARIARQILPGFEGLDSAPFTDWLGELRNLYVGKIVGLSHQGVRASDSERVISAISLLAAQGDESIAHDSLLALGRIFAANGMTDESMRAQSAARGILRWKATDQHQPFSYQ